jgi:calcineurin-like phosphoesterase family protein
MYFTADLHFNHRKILTFGKGRPFASVEEMNEALIQRWNETVEHYYDPVYVLGDFAFWYQGAQDLEDIFYRLNGEKHLVVGNHDEQNRKVLRLPWKTQTQLNHVRYGEHRFVLCHFPLERWWHSERGTLHLHGHCHGSAPVRPHRFDVGVDIEQRFQPWAATELIEMAAAQPFVPESHHV